MDSSRVFTGHVARLLSQLLREPADKAESERTLRGLEAANTVAVTLTWDNWRLRSNGEMVPQRLPGVQELVARMAAHAVRVMSFPAGTPAVHLLGAIGILAQDPVIGDGGENAVVRLGLLGADGITFLPVLDGAGAELEEETTQSSSHPREDAVPLPGIEDFELADVELSPASPSRRSSGAARRTSAKVVSGPPAAPGSPQGLSARLAAASTVGDVMSALDAMVAWTERAAADVDGALTVLLAIIAKEARFTDADLRLSFRAARKRIATPQVFQRLAEGLPEARERFQDYMLVFTSGGDDGVDALIEALANAESARERRVLFDTLVGLRRGIKTLMYMLTDRRWYVARNAAELLGEMRATEAERALIEALRYDDARVRRSATGALARLSTPAALAALSAAMHDPSPNVRMQATMAVTEHPVPATLPTIIKALADEQDPAMQRTLLVALGKIRTPEAIRRLIAAAEPERGLFKRKAVPLRLAAVEVLADVKTPEATAAMRALAKDKESAVREAALQAIAAMPGPGSARAPAHAGWGR